MIVYVFVRAEQQGADDVICAHPVGRQVNVVNQIVVGLLRFPEIDAEVKRPFPICNFQIPRKTMTDRARHIAQSIVNGRRIVIFSSAAKKKDDQINIFISFLLN
ncbi:MAG: hypothetical protein GY803_15585 [Chloroflexi bacterium]|nr:hypothetical protein [Chloroflexota bacterium]